jgi:hypothetical protein
MKLINMLIYILLLASTIQFSAMRDIIMANPNSEFLQTTLNDNMIKVSMQV